ncbi:MAG: N-acetylmuramoyl-L-alanine amidase [Pseudomonadota bacterium]
MTIINHPSPNFDERSRDIDMAILHYTGMRSGEEALARLCDEAAKVSAHYLVEEDGRVFQLVDEENRAWHAGVASWRGEADVNARSIGIEIVNPGHEFGYRDFPEVQIDAVVALLAGITERRRIDPRRVLAHSDVAPERKEDPGEKFPWARLAAEGLAIAPYDGEGDSAIAYEEALAALSAIGYRAPPGAHAAALLAFQRRFCPASLGQGFDAKTKAALISINRSFK